jgi:hypothetical protein
MALVATDYLVTGDKDLLAVADRYSDGVLGKRTLVGL